MYRNVWAFAWTLLLAVATAGAQEKPRLADALALEVTMQEAIRKAEPSIACILITRSEEPNRVGLANPEHVPESYGSGVVIDEKGLVLTQRHVVTGATRIFVRLPGGKGSYADIHADDPRSDLAVLRLLDPKVLPVPALKMGDGGAARKGQFVLSLANPFAAGFRDGSPSASWGIISNVRRRAPRSVREADQNRTLHHYGTLLQTDARLNLGTSGGALIDLKGDLIGLTTSLAAIAGGETPGGFAVPLDTGMRRVIDVLKRGEEVEYGFLGVTPFQRGREDGRRGGIPIQNVLSGSPASQAGLRDNDLVLKVNGVEVNDPDDLFLAIGTHLAGSTVRLEVCSPAGAPRTLTVTLAKFYVPEKLGKPFVTNQPPAPGGLRVDYTSILAQRQGAVLFGGGVPPGVMIREVKSNSVADQRGLQVDKVITHVNGQPVHTPAEFYRVMERAKGQVELALYSPDGRSDKVKIDLR